MSNLETQTGGYGGEHDGSHVDRTNPYINQLSAMGIPLEVPSRFTDSNRYPPGTRMDALTGLPVEEGDMRILVAKKLTDAVKKGRTVVGVYVDADNLKKGNTVGGHPLGDCVIKNNAASICGVVDGLNLTEESEVYIMRPGMGADEVLIFIFGAPADELTEIKQRLSSIPRHEASVVNPDTHRDIAFTFSATTAVITSDDPEMRPVLDRIRESSYPIEYDAYEMIKRNLDTTTRLSKIRNDITRLDFSTLGDSTSVQAINDIFTAEFGDSRVSTELLKISYEILIREESIRLLPFIAVSEEQDWESVFQYSPAEGKERLCGEAHRSHLNDKLRAYRAFGYDFGNISPDAIEGMSPDDLQMLARNYLYTTWLGTRIAELQEERSNLSRNIDPKLL
jgi:GGDEF domain-containing protein